MRNRTKITLFISAIALLVGSFLISPHIAYALPYGNETLGPDAQLVSSQPTYIPNRKINLLGDDSFKAPQDMCIDKENDLVYVADSGNKRIVELSLSDSSHCKIISSYKNADNEIIDFKNPTGVTVNSSYLYVSDPLLQKIVIFDKTSLNEETITSYKELVRPDSILVGRATQFTPNKVKADDSGNIYTVLTGETKGVMQLDNDGNFISYIGANTAITTLTARLKAFFGITDNSGLNAAGAAVTNICLDNKGLLYTITNGTGNALKKLNTTGNTILTMNYNDPTTNSAFIDEDGNIFSVQGNGYVTVYDSYGSLLFRFGGRSDEDILGRMNTPISCCLSKDDNLLVLDNGLNMLVEYTPTYFANVIFEAVSYYKEGLYLEGEAAWIEVLKYNSKFILAYKALAKASMKRNEYETALKQFRLAEDKAGYSEAFWQIRDNWIRRNLVWVIIPVIVVVILYFVYSFVDKKKPALFAPVKGFFNRGKQVPVVKDLGLMFTFMRNPSETIYEIKFKKRASLIGAIVLYIFFAAIQVLRVYLTGYLFNDVGRSDGLRIILMSTLPLLLLVVCNYYVASVSDGEGKFKDVFTGFIYALSPYLIFSLPLFLISNVVTYNEQAIYFMVMTIVYAWCAINIVLTVMELHDYSFWKAILNIILTLVCFILVIAFALIVYVLGYQLFAYLSGVLKEVMMR